MIRFKFYFILSSPIITATSVPLPSSPSHHIHRHCNGEPHSYTQFKLFISFKEANQCRVEGWPAAAQACSREPLQQQQQQEQQQQEQQQQQQQQRRRRRLGEKQAAGAGPGAGEAAVADQHYPIE